MEYGGKALQNSIRISAIVGLALLGACSEPEIILPGDRETVREVLSDGPLNAIETEAENSRAPVALGAAVRNSSWTQSPVSPATRVANAMLDETLTPVWSTSIGQGDKRRARVTTDPVASDGRIFTLDSASKVQATATDGSVLWTVDLTPVRDRSNEAAGGGLAVGDGRLYVTSGFGTLTALDPATGQEIWTQNLLATGTGTPSYYDGLVYLVSGDTTAWAVEADTGRVRWQFDGLADVNNVSGGAAPVVTNERVVFSFGNGDIQSAFRKGGLRLWSGSVVGDREGYAISTVDDVTGAPFVLGNRLFAGSFSGRTIAFDVGNGERLWTAKQGAAGSVWAAGNSVFVVSDLNSLVRLDAATGEQIWSVQLPGYVERRRPQAKRDTAYTHHGPIIAGGRVIVASSDGLIREFDPESGDLVATTEINGGATTAPIVVDGVLYVVSTRGQLHAYR